jgi:PAS domain-containing protein
VADDKRCSAAAPPSTGRVPGDTHWFLRADGQMASLMQRHDWSGSPLGAPDSWSATQRTLVGLMLESTQPMFIAWGPQRTWLYNDAFIPILGHKHPQALGRPAMQVWTEARGQLEPLFDRVFRGEAVHMEDIGLLLDREGRLVE